LHGENSAATEETAAASRYGSRGSKTEPAATTESKPLKVGIVVAEYNEWNHLYYAEIEEKCKEYGWTSEVFDAGQDVNHRSTL
jgi:hypothetical protein